MWALIKRNLDEMVMTTLRSSGITHIISGMVIILLMWILGTHVFGWLSTKDISFFLILIGMMVAAIFYTFSNIEEDASNRQNAFLQLLPVRKRYIIHAKFLSNLIVCIAAFIWISVLISANLLINDTWTLDAWLPTVVFVSTLLCLVSGGLLWNFTLGNKRGFWYFYAMFIVWTVLLYQLIGPIQKSIAASFSTLSVISLGGAAGVFLICWWISAAYVRRKGFPEEIGSIAIEKEQAKLEALKRRYDERKGSSK